MDVHSDNLMAYGNYRIAFISIFCSWDPSGWTVKLLYTISKTILCK